MMVLTAQCSLTCGENEVWQPREEGVLTALLGIAQRHTRVLIGR
jgi:hypothetical protein